MDKKMSHKKKGMMAALCELRDAMSGMMKDDMSEMKKVSVMAKDDEGLAKGLEMAKKIAKKKTEDEEYEDEE